MTTGFCFSSAFRRYCCTKSTHFATINKKGESVPFFFFSLDKTCLLYKVVSFFFFWRLGKENSTRKAERKKKSNSCEEKNWRFFCFVKNTSFLSFFFFLPFTFFFFWQIYTTLRVSCERLFLVRPLILRYILFFFFVLCAKNRAETCWEVLKQSAPACPDARKTSKSRHKTTVV